MLKLKLQYFGHLMGRANLLAKTLILGKIEGRRRRGRQRRRWLVGIVDSMHVNLGNLREVVRGGEACCAATWGAERVGHDLATEQQQQMTRELKCLSICLVSIHLFSLVNYLLKLSTHLKDSLICLISESY